jgi:HlyD family secretion protein
MGMDKIIEDKRWIKPKYYKYIIGGIIIITVILITLFRDPVKTVRMEKDKLSIETVLQGRFNDYISITGQVAPISTIYLDAVESGRIEEIMIEEGTMVERGDVILRLSNNNLNLSILNSEAQLAEKSNFLREVQIKMEQQKLDIEKSLLQIKYALKEKKRTYEQNKALYEEELIAKEDFLQSKEAYELQQQSLELFRERKKQDSLFRKVQTQQLKMNLDNMQKNLELVNRRLKNLNVKALVEGQLGMLNAEIGQSVAVGQRLGQINVLTSFKIEAAIDEHYIDRIKTGLTGYFERDTNKYELKVKKVYPEVREGHFIIDMVFMGEQPENIRTGQTYHIKLQMGLPKQSIKLARGSFFQSTGGQWAFVVDPSGEFAVKRPIKIGRQNPKYYEILDGLMPDEKVIVSNYEIFGNNDKVVFR